MIIPEINIIVYNNEMLCIYLKGLYHQLSIRQEIRTSTRMFGLEKSFSNYAYDLKTIYVG
jgi:hypothetical protein